MTSGCRPNPGAMGIAAVIGGEAEIDRDAGTGSSMDAESLPLIGDGPSPRVRPVKRTQKLAEIALARNATMAKPHGGL